MSRKLVSVVFAAAAFVAAFASSAMVSSASAQWPGQYSYPGGTTAHVPPVYAAPVVPAFHGGPHYGPPRGYGHYAPPPPPRYYGHHRRWEHRRGPPPWAYGPPRHRGYGW